MAWRCFIGALRRHRGVTGLGRDALARLFHGHVPGHVRLLPLGPRPEDRVEDNALNERVVVDGVGLVAWTKIEDAPAAARPTVPATKDFAAFKPRDEDLLIRRRDAEGLTIHL